MFNFFKSKPKLKELIPKGFIDIHSHILPAIDDGAKNVDESIKLIHEMKKMGFTKMVATPHIYPGLHNNDKNSIKKSFDLLKRKYPKDITYAGEYLIGNYLIELAERKSLLCIDKNHVLLEFSYMGMPANLHPIVFSLIVNGYKPILAHPERYVFFEGKLKEYAKLKKIGLNFQLNFLSMTGYYGNQVLRNTNLLIENNLINYIGSDIHNFNHILEFDRKIKINNLKKFENIWKENKLNLI